MANFKKYDFEKLFQMEDGYVLDFSNGSFATFIEESIGVDIYSNWYADKGNSKAKRLRTLWNKEDNAKVAKLLTDILYHFVKTNSEDYVEERKDLLEACTNEIAKMQKENEIFSSKLSKLSSDEDISLKELKISLSSELDHQRYNAVLDRLHTFTVKYFRNKATAFGIDIDKNKPLHSLCGEVFKKINVEQSEMTERILKSSISVFDRFNVIRNENSFAHDNFILDNREAKLIVNWVFSILEFVEDIQILPSNTIDEIEDDFSDEVPF